MSSKKIEDLTPRMQNRIILFEAQLEQAELHFHRSCTMRTQEEQDALYMRGRDSLDIVNAAYEAVGLSPITEDENKRPVTWTRHSNHTPKEWMDGKGEAVDYYQEVKGRASYDIKVDADFDNIPDWVEFVKIAEMCGLEAGGSWDKKDWPHVQYPQEG